MRWSVVGGNLGRLLQLWSIALAAPGLLAWATEPATTPLGPITLPLNAVIFLTVAAGSALAGSLLRWIGSHEDLLEAEAYVLVGLGWLTCAAVGSLPFMWNGVLTSPLDAFFETMSGMTTTGYSAITIPMEAVDRSIHFWRALLQWIGGMGIVVLTVAVLKGIATSGARLMQAEVPGEETERLMPQITSTARTLWFIYAGLTALGILVLWPIMVLDVGLSAGEGLFEAVFHTFTAIATGGFSTRSASIASFASPLLEWALMAGMVLGGMNFALHFQWMQGRFRRVWEDEEFRFYASAVVLGSLLVAGMLWVFAPLTDPLWRELGGRGVLNTVRAAGFQFISAGVNAGFTSAHYDTWPEVARFLIFFAMFMGGCVGSTGGSIKVGRVVLMFKTLKASFTNILHPRAVVPVKLSGRAISSRTMARLGAFLFSYLALFVLGTGLLLVSTDLSIFQAASWSAGSLGNVGASFGGLGPDFVYGAMPPVAKAGMAVLMWLGRLEIFAVLTLFAAETYR